MAFKILKDAGYAPEWIELDKAIRGKLARTRAALARSWEWRGERLGELAGRTDSWGVAERERVLEGWQKAMAAFEQEVADINAEIAELNLKVPGMRFQRSKVDVASEIGRIKGTLVTAESEPEMGARTQEERMAETVRMVVTRRERAPRSPRMERALKRLIWRYTRGTLVGADEQDEHVERDVGG
jgi:hypothetical protein